MSSHRIEIIKELRALEQFCTFKAIRTGEENERFLKDYLADIEDYPLDAIQKACAEWRRSGATKFPTSGQLIPIIRKHEPAKPSSAPRNGPWRWPTEAEYASLDLPEKIRQRRLMADQCRRLAAIEAAKTGWDRNVANAPPIYRDWMAKAESHEDEIKTLRRHLRTVPAAAE